MDPAAGRSGQDSLTWIFDENGRDGRPRLMYGARASDEMAVNLQCERGSRQVDILVIRMENESRRGGRWPFLLVSGDERSTLDGVVEGDSELHVSARLSLDAPVLTAFLASQNLAVGDPGQTLTEANAINAQERAAIAAFFEACAG